MSGGGNAGPVFIPFADVMHPVSPLAHNPNRSPAIGCRIPNLPEQHAHRRGILKVGLGAVELLAAVAGKAVLQWDWGR